MRERETHVQPELLTKLDTIGLTHPEYISVCYALVSRDLLLLNVLNRKAQERLQEDVEGITNPTTQDEFSDGKGVYTPERELFHQEIIEDLLTPLAQPETPKFYILAGPPGAGKTTAIPEFIDSATTVVTDPTLIQKKLISDFDESDYAKVLATKDEAFDIAEKLIDKAFEKRLSITSESTLQNLPWATRSLKNSEKFDYRTEIIFIHKPLEQCFVDAIEKRKRPISLNYLFKSVQGYENLIYFDEFPDVTVTVVEKTSNHKQSIIYRTDRGELKDNVRFLEIKNHVDSLKNLRQAE